jgi:hypothetical protein
MSKTNRTAQLSPDEAVGYAPVAPLAVVALGISVVTALIIAGLWLTANHSGKPIYQPALLLPGLAGAVIALVAGKQIRASDGTKSGRKLASVALWTAGLTCAIYIAYLIAVDLAIRNESSKFSIAWIDKVATAPSEAALLDCLDPATRQSIDPQDHNGIRERFDNELAAFRRNDIIRLIRRSSVSHDVKLLGIREWSLADGGYVVHQVFEFHGPEGKFELRCPVLGRDMPAMGRRSWQVSARRLDMASREMTALGRLVFDLQLESHRHLMEWTQAINSGKSHDAFLETLPLTQREAFKNRLESPEEQQFQAGSLVLVDGKPPTADVRKRYATELARAYAINTSPGSAVNQVGAPMVEFAENGVRLFHQVEIGVQDSATPVVAYVTVEVQGDDLVAELLRLKNDKDWRKQAMTSDRPGSAEIDRFPKRGFRIVAVDVKPNEKPLTQSMPSHGR